MAERSRIEAGRRRVRQAKRALAGAAVAGFAVVLVLARQGHPASGRPASSGVAQPSSSVRAAGYRERDDDSTLAGGSLAPSGGGAPSAASHTS